MTQADLARRVGVHESTVTAWETGKHFPRRYQGKIEAVLGMSLDSGEAPEIQPRDPLEEAIWAERSLPPDMRREIIQQLRQARKRSAALTERPPA